MRTFQIFIFFIFFYLLIFPPNIFADIQKKRFFLIGDGQIYIKNAKTGEEANVTLFSEDGTFDKTSLERIDEIFNFPTYIKGENISLRLIFMLDYFSDIVAPGKVIIIESGYRSVEYNNELIKKGGNTAKTSTHLDGLAVDFYIEGVSGKRLWDLIKQHQCCGVGHYGGDIIHLDAGRPRFWEAHTSKVRSGESDYNRKIFLSSEYDRYRAGERVRLSFSSVSNFGFGIKKNILLISQKGHTMVTTLDHNDDHECLMINDRKSSRFIFFLLPENVEIGRYRIRIDFCNRPFEQMPIQVLSNEIEIIN